MEKPEKIKMVDSLRSLYDFGSLAVGMGKVAVAGIIHRIGEIPGRIDTYFANQVNGEDDE